jgi:predicted Zn finger-like uncharacterized protein
MSFITRCPACHTAFKVVSDQLKISEGWVRCGHCQQVFDATLDLQPWWPELPAEPVPQPAPTSPPAPMQQPAFVPPAVIEPSPSPEPDPEPSTEPDPEPQSDPKPAPQPVPVEAFSAVDADPEPTRESWSGSVPERAMEPPTEPSLEQPLRADEPLPSFVRQAQRRAFWRRPWVRWSLGLVLVLLTAVLGVQAALHWRDPLAAHAPQAQPALETLCAPVDCKVEPPRQLEHIVIDSSVLLRREPGRYTFNVVVRNTASVELTAPALELTLTDLQDQVVVRRVLLPHEWPEPRATLAPGAEWPVQFELELDAPQAQVMTGYRAILFYP